MKTVHVSIAVGSSLLFGSYTEGRKAVRAALERCEISPFRETKSQISCQITEADCKRLKAALKDCGYIGHFVIRKEVEITGSGECAKVQRNG